MVVDEPVDQLAIPVNFSSPATLGQSASEWLVEHAGVRRSSWPATVAGLILAALVWLRRATVCRQREERKTGLVSATMESAVVAVATGRRTSARTQRE